MKIVKVLAPFGLSALLFVLAYLSSMAPNTGSYPVILMGMGIILAVVAIIVIFSDIPDKKAS